MSERERLLSAAEPAPAPGASPAGGDPGLSPAPPHHPTDSVGERRRALTRRFLRNTFACACACATLLACHTQLASVTFGGRVESADDDPSGGASSDASAQSLLAREVVVAAAGVPKSQRYSGSYPPWWNDRASLPDAQPIFIHIPKTGGVSVEDTASRAGHVTGACVVHSFGDAALPYALAPGFEMEPYHAPPARFVPYSFTIVRSPYARMVSEFNWMALSDPAKAADIKAGRWSFTCGEFQDFVERRVDGLVGSALFRCLAQSALNEADYERCVAENPSAETINDSHALPQWFLAKNAERVFKYEQFASEVWPFLKRVGVVSRGEKTLEKINSAGGASAVASECWAFVSSAVLEKFVRMYAMDFKNLGYSETDFGLDAAGASAGLGRAEAAGPDAEALKRRRRLDVVSADVDGDILAETLEFRRANARGSRGARSRRSENAGKVSEVAGETPPGCVRADGIVPLGERSLGSDWSPAGWAVAEGVLRRATFATQAFAAAFKSRQIFVDATEVGADPAAGLGGPAGLVAETRRAARKARWAAELAARDPLGPGSVERVGAAARACADAARRAEALKAAAEVAGSGAPQALIDAAVELAEPAAEAAKLAAQAVRARRAWETQLAAATRVDEANARRATRRANDDAAGSLGGASSRRRSETVADALSKHGPETAGLSGAIGRRASPTNPEGERDGAEDER